MKLNDRKFKEFYIGDIFNINTGALLPKKLLKKGNVPRITATDLNNGVFDYYAEINHRNFRSSSNFISVSFLGSVFYHPYKASLDMKIHSIRPKDIELNKYLAHFLIIALKKITLIFSYGDQLSSSDLPKKKILLPINLKETPDWAFIESYIKEKYQEKENKYREYVNKAIDELDYKAIEPLEEKEWKEFFINDIFHIKSGVRLTKTNMTSGKRPFIGSIDSNNGISNFVSDMNSSLDKNVLGVNYNGSVCEIFYHPYECIFTDDVKHLSLKNIEGNKYIYLFFKQIIYKQKIKYSYGYKFNANRMERQIVLVPVDDKKEPDYDYMEQYIKNMMLKKYNQYLNK